MSTTVNNNDASSSISLKVHMFSSNTNSRSQCTHDDSDTENEQRDDESRNNVDVPTYYQLSDTLLGQYKHMVNIQGLLEEECIIKKDEISELNKEFNFPSNFQVNVAPFGTPEGISMSSTVKNNDTDLLIVEKRINDSLKPLLLMSSMLSSTIKNNETDLLIVEKRINDSLKTLLLMSSMLSSDSSNVDVELISYLAQSAIVLAVNAQASLSRVRLNNIAKEIYGSEVLLPIKIKDTPKMFDETKTERSNAKELVNSSCNNTTGNSSNSKSSSGINGRSNNFNGSSSNVASGSNNTKSANEEKEENLPVGGRLFHNKQVWKGLGLPNFCQEVLNGLKFDLLPNFKPMPNPIPFSIPEGPKSDCITKEVQDFDSTASCTRFKKAKLLHQQPNIKDVRNKESTIDGQTRLLHDKTRYQESLHTRVSRSRKQRLIPLRVERFALPVIDSSSYLYNAVRMLRDINVSVIAFLDDMLIFGSTKEECLSNLKKTMDLLVKLGFKLNLEKSVLEPTQLLFSDYCCSPRKLAGLKGKLIALKDAVIPFRLYTRRTNKFHSQCLTLANGDWDQSFPIPQDVNSKPMEWEEISLFASYDYVLTTDASESGAGATLKKGNKTNKTWSVQWSTTQSNMSSNRRKMLALLMAYQALWWSDTGPISSVRTTLETMPQEESELDWRAYSRILQCKSRPPQPSFRDESQIIVQSNQELQLATEEGSVQSHPTSVRSNPNGSVRISPEPSNVQLLNNQNESTPPRLESMEAMSGLPTTHSFAFYPGEDELIQFEEGFYNTDLPNLEISNLVSDDSITSSSTGNIPRSIDSTDYLVLTKLNSTTLESGDHSTFQSHVMSIIRIQKSSTAELMKSWEPSTLKVYSSIYTRFRNFCTSNSANPANITLVVFMDYLTHLFKHKPPLAFSTINSHRSMLNQLLLLKNHTDIVNDPFITRIMTGIHKLRPSSAKNQEIWDANQVFKHLSTIKVIPKYTYTALLKKTLVLCKMFGLARSSDLVKWSFNGLIITPDSIKGPVINAKEQRKGVLSILELTSLDDTNSQVCPVRHLATYLRAFKGRRKPHSCDSFFIQNEGKSLDVKEINIIVLSTLSSSGIDFNAFYDKRIIGEKSGGFLNTVVQIS
ncbi:hypothetical protein ACTFIW_010339 [Dictyostelium discoideum]